MTFREFENEIKATLAKYIREKSQVEKYTELVLGLYEEGAEVTSIIRRSIPGNFHETKIDSEHLGEEIGDIIWYIAQISLQLPNIDFEKIAAGNLEKTHTIYQKDCDTTQLSIQKYQQGVINTYRNDLPPTNEERARLFAMGLIKEIGKISELFGEHKIDNIRLDIYKVKEKLGDCLWYSAAICENYGLDLEKIARENIQKTKGRYNQNGIPQIPEKKEWGER